MTRIANLLLGESRLYNKKMPLFRWPRFTRINSWQFVQFVARLPDLDVVSINHLVQDAGIRANSCNLYNKIFVR